MTDPYDIKILHPKEISIHRTTGGIVVATIREEIFEEVYVFRTYPFTKPFEYISIRNKEKEELGIIKDIKELDRNSCLIIEEELRYRYLIPQVNRIEAIREETGLWMFDLNTDRGPMQMLMRNLHDHIQTAADRLLITDMDGNRCEIKNLNELDKQSQKELSKIL